MGSGDSEEVVEEVDLSVRVEPPDIDSLAPMDDTSNLGNILQSNSHRGRSPFRRIPLVL